MKIKDAEKAKKLFIHTAEKINQSGIKITNVQIEKFKFLARNFNTGSIDILKLKDALIYVYSEAINMAGKDYEKFKDFY